MRNSRKAVVSLGAAVAGIVLGVVSMAFACSPRCCFANLAQDVGPAGSRLLVQGSQFWGNAAPVNAEIRWNSLTGPVLATATAEKWERTITIPNVAPGFYSIVALGRDSSTGEIFDYTAPTFQVTATASNAPPAADSVAEPTPAPASQTTANQPASEQAPVAASSSAPAAATPVGSSSSAATAAPTPANSSVGSPAPATAATPAPVRSAPASARPTAAPTPTAPPAPATSQAPAATPAQQETSAPVAASPDAVPAEATPIPQPWSPSLRSGASLASAPPSGGGSMEAGGALLAAGAVGLFGALAAIVVRRRTVRSTSR